MAFWKFRRSPESMRRLYNWFYLMYGSVERAIGSEIDRIVQDHIAIIPNVKNKTAIEYACGTGLLTLKVAPFFRAITAYDQSTGMLSKARQKKPLSMSHVTFLEGNILDIRDLDRSADWVFVSMALHLFSSEQQIEILSRSIRVAREGVMIIDHSKTWSPLMALVEWLEGSYYDEYLRNDFAAVASQIGAFSYSEISIDRCSVMIFRATT